MSVPCTFCLRGLARAFWLSIAVLCCALAAQAWTQDVSTQAASGDQAPSGNAVSSKALAQKLEQRHPRNETLQGGKSRQYEIQLKKGEFLHVEIEEQGISVSARLFDPDGKGVRQSPRSDIPAVERESFGREVLSAVAGISGGYELRVTSTDPEAPPGHYKVEIAAIRTPTSLDLKRLAAEQTFREGLNKNAEQSAQSSNEAVEKFESSLPVWREIGDSFQEATTLDISGNILFDLGEIKKAREYLSQALVLQRSMGDRVGEANSLNLLGRVCSRVNELQKGLEYYSDALAIERSAGDLRGEAISIRGIGRISAYLGNDEKTQEDWLRALALERMTHDVKEEVTTSIYLGGSALSQGDKKKAQEHFLEAFALAIASGDNTGQASSLRALGGFYQSVGELEKALDCMSRALVLTRALGDRAREASTLDAIGSIYVTLGDNQKALDYLSQSLALWGAMADRGQEATVLNWIGVAYERLGDVHKGVDYYFKALALWREIGHRDGEAWGLNNIGAFYARTGSPQSALEYYSLALLAFRSLDNRYGEAWTLDNVGAAYFTLGQTDKVLECYTPSLVLSRQMGNPLPEAQVLSDLMRYWKQQLRPAVAIVLGKEAINRYQLVRRNIHGLEKETQRSFADSKEKTYRELADLLITEGRLPEAEQVLDLLKQEEYFDFIRRDAKAGLPLTDDLPLTPDDNKIDKRYQEAVDRATAVGADWAALRAKPSRTQEEEKRLATLNDQLALANAAFDKLWKDLYAEYGKSSLAEKTVQSRKEDTSELQSLVRESEPGTVVLYTLVGEEKYRVLVITPSVMVSREYPVSAKVLRKKVLEFRRLLQSPSSDPTAGAQELYKMLVAPLANDLDNARAQTLVWILDDDLRYLPMAALHDGKDYLVAKYRNVVITRAVVGHLKEQTDASGWKGLGMGISKSYEGMPELPAVSSELHAIIREDGTNSLKGVIPGQIMLDENFTVKKMTKALEDRFPVVHIASHFRFSPGDETRSFLVVGGEKDEKHELTLAEIRERPDISFDRVELLALSACETATGETERERNGVEIDGFAVTAQRKGAKAVIASLWDVNDLSTAQLMVDFYRRLLGPPSLNKGEALRQAQLAMLHGTVPVKADAVKQGVVVGSEPTANRTKDSYQHPYYWAPFVLIGNWK